MRLKRNQRHKAKLLQKLEWLHNQLKWPFKIKIKQMKRIPNLWNIGNPLTSTLKFLLSMVYLYIKI